MYASTRSMLSEYEAGGGGYVYIGAGAIPYRTSACSSLIWVSYDWGTGLAVAVPSVLCALPRAIHIGSHPSHERAPPAPGKASEFSDVGKYWMLPYTGRACLKAARAQIKIRRSILALLRVSHCKMRSITARPVRLRRRSACALCLCPSNFVTIFGRQAPYFVLSGVGTPPSLVARPTVANMADTCSTGGSVYSQRRNGAL
ncbi:hypothetical protein BDZ91DRAFT_780407 [Kalaharituber pfeilii]|nr:hypothetical protein BDZ91DRAFT_780407 [Kalaharituber pfeilii]